MTTALLANGAGESVILYQGVLTERYPFTHVSPVVISPAIRETTHFESSSPKIPGYDQQGHPYCLTEKGQFIDIYS